MFASIIDRTKSNMFLLGHNFVFNLANLCCTVKPVLSSHSKIDKTEVTFSIPYDGFNDTSHI